MNGYFTNQRESSAKPWLLRHPTAGRYAFSGGRCGHSETVLFKNLVTHERAILLIVSCSVVFWAMNHLGNGGGVCCSDNAISVLAK